MTSAPDRARPMAFGRLLLLAAVAALTCLLAPLATAEAAKGKKQRIVALTPFSANVLAQLGKKPVGIGEGVGEQVDLHPKLRNVPELPLSHASNGPNLEELLALDPDLMLSERTWRAGHKDVRNLGIRVAERDPYRVSNIQKKVVEIGKTIGKAKRARKLGKRYAKGIRAATRGSAGGPSVLMLLGVGQTTYAFLSNSWGGNIVSRAGGELITDGLEPDGEDFLVSGGFAQISCEEIILSSPDVVIAVPHGREEDIEETEQELRENECIENTNAGDNDRVYVTADNGLLQANTTVAKTIREIRRKYLGNL